MAVRVGIAHAVLDWGDILPVSVKLCPSKGGVLGNDQALMQKETVRLQFYYETGCPYSIKRYTEELEDTVKELGPYLDITTYPYGNGHMKLNGSRLTITCQHREAECYGNELHACAIDALKDAARYVPFNSCMMGYHTQTITNDEAADACGNKLNVDSKSIKECAKGIRGFELLLHYGIESGKAKYDGVPWWYVNGVSITEDDYSKPLKKTLCATFKNPPEVCKN